MIKRNGGLNMKIAMFIFVILLQAVAARAAENNPVGEALSGFLADVIFPVISAFLVGMVGVILNKIRQKYNLEIDEQMQGNLEIMARNSVAYVEERVAAFAKQDVTAITGREKLDMAITYMLDAAPGISTEQADRLIHSALGQVADAGATGEKQIL